MGVKISFYTSITNNKSEEKDLLEYYEKTDKGQCIYCIEAGEICSEFIARYFRKTNIMPGLLSNKIAKEYYPKESYENAIKDMYSGAYKANVDIMIQDSLGDFEFKTYKESKRVREKLLDKYNEIDKKLKQSIEKPNIEIYALLGI